MRTAKDVHGTKVVQEVRKEVSVSRSQRNSSEYEAGIGESKDEDREHFRGGTLRVRDTNPWSSRTPRSRIIYNPYQSWV